MKATVAPKKPTLFVALSGINVSANLGRGERIASSILVTNDIATKREIVTEFFEPTIGTFDYSAVFKDSTLLAYSQPQGIEVGKEQDSLRGFFHELNYLGRIYWLTQDHALRHNDGYLWANGRIYQNSSEGVSYRADGSQTDIQLSREEFRKFRGTSREEWKPVPFGSLRWIPSRDQARVSRAFHYVSCARLNSICMDKLINYCSALEALFATANSELVHLLAERTAVVVADSLDERLAVYQHVRKCYKYRSAYSHGSSLKQSDINELPALCLELDRMVRRCINRIFEDEEFAIATDKNEQLDGWFLKKLFS